MLRAPALRFRDARPAKEYLLRVIRVLRKEILWGVPILVLEPSCAAVFRDELKNLLPDNEQAQRLSKQTFLWSEWLDKNAPHLSLPECVQHAKPWSTVTAIRKP